LAVSLTGRFSVLILSRFSLRRFADDDHDAGITT
jgi:hypothetical protein